MATSVNVIDVKAHCDFGIARAKSALLKRPTRAPSDIGADAAGARQWACARTRDIILERPIRAIWREERRPRQKLATYRYVLRRYRRSM